MENDGEPDLPVIHTGQTFESVEAAKEYIKKFNEENFTNFVVETNNKRSLVLYCKHSVNRDSKSKGKRIHLHYNYNGCAARIRMYKSQKADELGNLKVTAVEMDHNHIISKDIYESENIQFTSEERDLVAKLNAGNCQTSQIRRVLLEKSQKNITIQRLKNLVAQICPPEEDDQLNDDFEKFLDNTEVEGGDVEWIEDKDKTMKALFITSQKMKSAFRAANPTLMQLDTSFEFEKARYKVAAFCYLDPNSDKTEIAAYAMMSEESTVCFEFVLRQFSRICVRQDLIFIIDKDFTECRSIKKVFPAAIVLLCIFHCLKFMRTLFSTIPEVVEIKEEVMDQFKRVVYSHDEKGFDAETDKFELLVKDLQVRTLAGYVNLKEYYVKNWKSCKLMWSKCFRKGLPLLGDNTTNRIENKFGRLKVSIKDTFKTLPTTAKAIIHLVNYADKLLEERYLFRTNKSLKIFSSNPKVRVLNEAASLHLNEKGCKLFNLSLKTLEEKREKMEVINDMLEETYHDGTKVRYSSSNMSCNCSSFKQFQAPCVHILYIRELENLTDENFNIFSMETFNERYHRNHNLMDILNHEDDIDESENLERPAEDLMDDSATPTEPEKLNDKQKYKKIVPTLMTIANLVSIHPTKKFFEYLSEFEKIENLIRRGETIFDEFEVVPDVTDTNEQEVTEDDESGVDQVPAELQAIEEAELDTGEEFSEESLDVTLPQKSRFAGLAFKERVKTRGRPKRKVKQLTFNKTAVDRKSKPPRRAKKTKKSAEDFIDDDAEEDLELTLPEEEDVSEEEELGEEEEQVGDEIGGSEGEFSSSGEITFNNNNSEDY